jgi:hypothetical protein
VDFNGFPLAWTEMLKPAAYTQDVLYNRVGERPVRPRESRSVVAENEVDRFGARLRQKCGPLERTLTPTHD